MRSWPPCTCSFHLRSLDTGRLNPETYRLFDAVEKHYGIHIEYTVPESQEVMELVRSKGLFSFYNDGHQECCRVRKVWLAAEFRGPLGPKGTWDALHVMVCCSDYDNLLSTCK